MLVKIIKTTNPRIEKYIGEIRRYFKLNGCACFEDLNKPGYGISTSRIITEKIEENTIIIKTKNSDYFLEIVEERRDGGKE